MSTRVSRTNAVYLAKEKFEFSDYVLFVCTVLLLLRILREDILIEFSLY